MLVIISGNNFFFNLRVSKSKLNLYKILKNYLHDKCKMYVFDFL